MRIIALFIVLLTSMPALAQTPNLTGEQRAFVQKYTQAIISKDSNLYWENIHPQSRKCMSESFKQFSQQEFISSAAQHGDIDPTNIRIEEINLPEVEAHVSKFYRNKAFVGVAPKYSLTLNEAPYKDGKEKILSCEDKVKPRMMQIPIAFHNGAWYEVMPCGKPDLDAYLDKQLAARAAQKKRVYALNGALSLNVWQVLKQVLTQDHDKEKAAGIIREHKKMSSSEARLVIDAWCKDLGVDKGPIPLMP